MSKLNIAHIYAKKAKSNSGDFFIGIATKKYFEKVILKTEKEVVWHSLDCRETYNDKHITLLNKMDYIVVGGGGLILPDSAPNKVSCWQWKISTANIRKINKPIYVLSIGWNLFFGQNINMPNRNNNNQDKTRTKIFLNNIKTLIKQSKHFTLRHKGDIRELKKCIQENSSENVDELLNKIKFEHCPTMWYCKDYCSNKFQKMLDKPNSRSLIAFEVKDDRPNRRYYKIGKQKYYQELAKVVLELLHKGHKVCYLSHDNSKSFYQYLKANKINIPYLTNSSANEDKILANYSKIKTLFCMAGHSQMMGYSLSCNIISLIGHPKLRYLLEDIGKPELGVEINQDNIYEKCLKIFYK